MIPYKNLMIFERNGVYTVGGTDNTCFDDCSLENIECGLDEFEMVDYCLQNNIKLKFDDLRGGIYDVSFEKYLEHLEKYHTDKECSFLNDEFIVPVLMLSSLDEAKSFVDWVDSKLKEQVLLPNTSLSAHIHSVSTYAAKSQSVSRARENEFEPDI